MNKRKTAFEITSEKIEMLNRERKIYHLPGQLAGELGFSLKSFFGRYPNNYQFALVNSLGRLELALMQIVLRMTYESMCTEWYFSGAQLKRFAKAHTPKINNRHTLPTSNDKGDGTVGVMFNMAKRGFFTIEKLSHTLGSKALHKVQITARTITLEGIANMKQINDGYHCLLGEANYRGLLDREYSKIGIIAYNQLNKDVKDHKKKGTKLPPLENFSEETQDTKTLHLENFREQTSPSGEIKGTKTTPLENFNEPICGESEQKDRYKTTKDHIRHREQERGEEESKEPQTPEKSSTAKAETGSKAETESGSVGAETAKAETGNSLDLYMEKWNSLAESEDLVCIVKLTGTRLKKLKARIGEVKEFSRLFDAALKKIAQNDFLLGKVGKDWRISFDWLIVNDTNIIKIYEGFYDEQQ